jgi:hypothetical protein
MLSTGATLEFGIFDPSVHEGWALGYPLAPGESAPFFDAEPGGLVNAFE